jgi:hypothetical protein
MIVVKLDEAGVITSVGGEWDEFAALNGGAISCAQSNVVGRHLRDFVKGSALQMWIEVTIWSAVKGKKLIERPYRCDSPTEKRHLLMRVVPEEKGVRIEHHLVRVEPMRHPVALAFEEQAQRQRCSVCNRIELGGVWYEPDAEDEEGAARFVGQQAVVSVLCPVCTAQQ